jgi:hypothetical protein
VDGPVNILRYLREHAKEYDCTVCGANHSRSEIRVLGKLERAWIVHVTCASCQTAFKLLILEKTGERGAGRAQEPTATVSTVKEERPRTRRRAPMTMDDVLDAHEHLKDFRGDVEALFKRGTVTAKRSGRR